MEEALSFDEIALHMVVDLKNEFVREFESCKRLFETCSYNLKAFSNSFFKGINPITTSQHMINSFSVVNERVSQARDSSSADEPAPYQVAAKRRRLENNLEGFEEIGDGGRQIVGDDPVVGKGHCVDAQEEGNDMDCMRVPQEDTTKIVQECTGGWPSSTKIVQECTGGWPSSSPVMTFQPNKDNSAAPVMIVAIRDNAGHGEEIVAAEVRVNSLDPVCEDSNDMYCKRIPQKDAPKIVQECAEGWPSARPYCGNSAHIKDAKQSEALDAIETIQLQDTSNIIENGQISHMTTPEMQIPSQFEDSFHPLESKAFGNIIQVDSRSVSNTSMLPEMVTSQSCIPYPTNNLRSQRVLVKETMIDRKRDIKVKALEAAGVAKQLEEKREQGQKFRKELARRSEHEKKFLEKSREEQHKGEKEGEGSSIACSDSNKSISSGMARKKPVGCTLQSQPGTFVIGVDLKLRRALDTKIKLEQEKLKKLEEKKKKEEERKKNAAEAAANKRKKEEMDKRDREEKRRRLEEAQKQQKELEEQLRAEKEAKEQRRRALDDYERKRKAMEEEAKKQRRIEKEREAAERRRRIEEDAKSNKFVSKDAKHMQDVHQHNETTLQAPNAYAGKVSSMSTSFAKGTLETEGQSMLDSNASLSSKSNINIESYEISPYKGSDEEDNDDVAPGKIIPLWARKENLIPHIISQQYIDPDEIFTGARTCSLNEVFESNGSNRRRDFKRRSHSGEWLNDCFTWKEEYQYKLQMGYINKGD